jgi:hypothetical protein
VQMWQRVRPSPGADVAGASPVPVQMWPVLGSDGCRRPMARSSSSRTATSSPARSTTSARACAPAQRPEQHACNHLAIGPRRRLVHRRSRSECARARPFAGDAQTSCDANGPARSAHDRKASRGPPRGPSSSRPLLLRAAALLSGGSIRTSAAVVARPCWTRRDRGHTAAHATVRGSSLCSARSLSEGHGLILLACLLVCLFVGCAVVLCTGHEGRPRADTGCRCGPALVQGRRFVLSPRALPAPPAFPYFPCPRSLARSPVPSLPLPHRFLQALSSASFPLPGRTADGQAGMGLRRRCKRRRGLGAVCAKIAAHSGAASYGTPHGGAVPREWPSDIYGRRMVLRV